MNSMIKSQHQTTSSSNSALDSVSRSSLITMGAVSGLVGLWTAACLVSALAETGGPIALVKSWFVAVSGF